MRLLILMHLSLFSTLLLIDHVVSLFFIIIIYRSNSHRLEDKTKV